MSKVLGTLRPLPGGVEIPAWWWWLTLALDTKHSPGNLFRACTLFLWIHKFYTFLLDSQILHLLSGFTNSIFLAVIKKRKKENVCELSTGSCHYSYGMLSFSFPFFSSRSSPPPSPALILVFWMPFTFPGRVRTQEQPLSKARMDLFWWMWDWIILPFYFAHWLN